MNERIITWADVGAAWHTASPDCEDCDYHHKTRESRPYGEGVVYEHLSACTLGDYPQTQSPDMCPATDHLKEDE